MEKLKAFTITKYKREGSRVNEDPGRICTLQGIQGLSLRSKDAEDMANLTGTLTEGILPLW